MFDAQLRGSRRHYLQCRPHRTVSGAKVQVKKTTSSKPWWLFAQGQGAGPATHRRWWLVEPNIFRSRKTCQMDSTGMDSNVKPSQRKPIFQWPSQEPKLEVPAIYKAYVREYPHKIWPEKWYSTSILGSWRSPIESSIFYSVLARVREVHCVGC